MEKAHTTLTIRCILFSTLFVLSIFGCGGDSDDAQSLHITTGDIHAPVQCQLVHGSLFVVNVLVNGSINLNMLMDTGSSRTYVPAGIFGGMDEPVQISSLCFENGVCFNDFMALSSDSAFTQSKAGYFNGIIGIDLLKNFDFSFDYKNQTIYFFDLLDSDASNPITLAIQYIPDRPFSNISIEGIPQGPTLLDTGSAFTRITASMVDALEQDPEVLFKSIVYDSDTTEVVDYIGLNDYCAGTACPGEITAQVGDWPAVGGTFFREYLTVFKFSQNRVELDRYEDRSFINESGIQRMGLQIDIFDASQIIYVTEGSAAWESGLREGDEIISVNGIPIGSLGYLGFYDLIADVTIDTYQFLIASSTGDIKDITMAIQ